MVAREEVNFIFHAAALCDFDVREVKNDAGETIAVEKAPSRGGALRRPDLVRAGRDLAFDGLLGCGHAGSFLARISSWISSVPPPMRRMRASR